MEKESPAAFADRTHVRTPVEVVDFTLLSVQSRLRTEFGAHFDHPDVRVLDPFCGDGVFLVRAAQLGLLKPGGESIVKQIEIDPERAARAKAAIDVLLPGRVETICGNAELVAYELDDMFPPAGRQFVLGR